MSLSSKIRLIKNHDGHFSMLSLNKSLYLFITRPIREDQKNNISVYFKSIGLQYNVYEW